MVWSCVFFQNTWGMIKLSLLDQTCHQPAIGTIYIYTCITSVLFISGPTLRGPPLERKKRAVVTCISSSPCFSRHMICIRICRSSILREKNEAVPCIHLMIDLADPWLMQCDDSGALSQMHALLLYPTHLEQSTWQGKKLHWNIDLELVWQSMVSEMVRTTCCWRVSHAN